MKGAVLRNTEFTLGVCIFAGTETKLMQNSKETPHKVSKIERTTNYMILLLFFFILFVATTCVIGWAIWLIALTNPSSYPPQWHVWWGYKFASIDIIASCVTFFVLFNNFIPISLYVTMELTKVWQAVVWINNDVKMFYDDGAEGKPARVKTASLVEELGQVEYVFSDKTGTLTQNKMEFLKFSVNGKGYGRGTTEIGRAAAVRRGEVLEDDRPKDWSPEPDGFQFYDPAVSKLAYRKDKNGKEIENFFKFLGVCHTVIPEPDKKTGGIFYNAASPDEGALVKAAKYMGYEFTKRTHDTASYLDPDGKEHTVKILNILEFNSTRKRMSIIFRDEDGTIRVYCKGADSVLWKLMSKDVKYQKETNDLLDKFGGEGLRTLLCAERVLDEKEWKEWDTNYWQPAIKDLTKDKKDKVADAAAMMETDLQLVGSTAIEDKLQDGVPATISTLQRAGIKVWVLTGDKQETAINIGYACAMLDNDMYKIILNDKRRSTLKKKIEQEMDVLKDKLQNEKETEFGVIVDGDTLAIILNWDKNLNNVYLEEGESLRISFLKLCMLCKSVICCRVSPLQKSQVVTLVKHNLGDVITLAIGDGANDVSMIQAAHIGVGISGEEGEQASRSADFAIAQFRFLQRLLLVHGRYAYRRIAKLILYFFYKNATLQFTQFYYVFFNGFSGTSLFDNQVLSLYNVIWTSLPVLGLSFFDKDLSADISEEFPELYILGQRNYYFNVPRFILWFLTAVYHSAICFFVPQLALQYSMLGGNALSITHRMMGTLIMGCVIMVVTFKLGIEVANWNPVFIVIVLFTIFIYPVFLFIYHILAPLTIWITPAGFEAAFSSWTKWLDWTKFLISGSSGFHDSLFIIFGGLRQMFVEVWFELYDMVQFPVIWLTLLIVIILALFKDILMKGFSRVFFTQLYHSLQETRSDKATRDYITSKYSSIIDSMHPPKRTYKKKWYQFIMEKIIKPTGLVLVEDDTIEQVVDVIDNSNSNNKTGIVGQSGEELQEISIDIDHQQRRSKGEDHHGFAFNQTENQTALLEKYTSEEHPVEEDSRVEEINVEE